MQHIGGLFINFEILNSQAALLKMYDDFDFESRTIMCYMDQQGRQLFNQLTGE